MDKRSKPRSKAGTVAAVFQAVTDAQRFGAKKATSHFVATYAHITPQYANRLLMELYKSGAIGFKWVRHRTNGWKREFVTWQYAKRHGYMTVEREPKNLELPL